MTGPTLRFTSDTVIALTGADFGARSRRHAGSVVAVDSGLGGSTLDMSASQGAGSRAYLAISGGFDVPEYLESRSTFILGGFGGHAGRVLRAGDVIGVAEDGRTFAHAEGACGTGPAICEGVGDRRSLRAARRAGFFHAGRHRDVLLDGVEGAPSFRPHGHPADRPQAHLGAAGWRRGGAASLEHPRQCLCHRHGRFHRRHAGDPGAGWPQPGRIRLPGDHRAGRVVEDGAAQAWGSGALPRDFAEPGGGDGRADGDGDRRFGGQPAGAACRGRARRSRSCRGAGRREKARLPSSAARMATGIC